MPKTKDKVLVPVCSLANVVWLVDHTALTFEQIATLGGFHPLEVQSIADGERGRGTKGSNPIATEVLLREEITKGEQDSHYQPKILKKALTFQKKGSRYTPLSKREKKPDAVAWLLNNIPAITDAQIIKLVGTTKTTISAIRTKSHWKMNDLQPTNPVLHGFCSQKDLDDIMGDDIQKSHEIPSKKPQN